MADEALDVEMGSTRIMVKDKTRRYHSVWFEFSVLFHGGVRMTNRRKDYHARNVFDLK